MIKDYLLKNTWLIYAVFSAFFASLVAILSKIGITGVNSNLATAIRTVVILIVSWSIVFITGASGGIKTLSKINLIFLILSGIATGFSWIFYFKALQIGEASKVVPIDKLSLVLTMLLSFLILGETPSIKKVVGGLLVAIGVLVIAM